MRAVQPGLVRFCRRLPLALLFAYSLVAQNAQTSPSGLVRLTLDDAVQRARQNSVVYQAAVTDARLAHEDKKQAVAGLLPSVNYNNGAIYTEGTGVDCGFACHTIVAAKDYVFTAYPKR